MEKNGQLTFSDDMILPGINNAYNLLETGDFENASKIFDEMLSKNAEYPGLTEGYRIARFWLNRRKDINELKDGKETADFYMNEWAKFYEYCQDKNTMNSTAYKAIQKFIFYSAAEHYKIAYSNNEDPTNNFTFLLNLGKCLITIGEYYETANILEYARNTYATNSKILSFLAEAYYHINDIPKSLLLFREAFLLDPSSIELDLLTSKPLLEIQKIVKTCKPFAADVREWIPVFGYIYDIFYVRRHINNQFVERLKMEILNFERILQTLSKDKKETSSVIPRLINRYLWLFDYFQFQNFNQENISDIKKRLNEIDKQTFEPYFKRLSAAKK